MLRFLTVGVRDVGPEHVVLAVHHLVHLLAVSQQFEVHETRLVPGKDARKGRAVSRTTFRWENSPS